MDVNNDPDPKAPDDLDLNEFDNEADNAELEANKHEFMRLNAPVIPIDDQSGPEPEPEPGTSTRPANGTYTRPPVVKHNSLAGQPIATTMSSQDSYSATLEDQDSQNIYAPFSGKLEWEVARWAKFQSHLSATAVTELLSIEGVRLLSNLVAHH
jgi:hypothetical protein